MRTIDTLWNEYLRLTGQGGEPEDDDIIYRNGKPYRKIDPAKAKWLRN